MEITVALATGRRPLREHGLDDWTIVADRAPRPAGVCRYSRRDRHQRPVGPRCTTRARCSTRSCTRLPTPSSGPGTVMMPCGRPRLARSVPAGGSTSRPRPLACPRTGRAPPGGSREVSPPRPDPVDVLRGSVRRGSTPQHLFTWTYRGRRVPLPPSYAEQLAALAETVRPTATRRPPVHSVTWCTCCPGRGVGVPARSSTSARCAARFGSVDEPAACPSSWSASSRDGSPLVMWARCDCVVGAPRTRRGAGQLGVSTLTSCGRVRA